MLSLALISRSPTFVRVDGEAKGPRLWKRCICFIKKRRIETKLLYQVASPPKKTAPFRWNRPSSGVSSVHLKARVRTTCGGYGLFWEGKKGQLHCRRHADCWQVSQRKKKEKKKKQTQCYWACLFFKRHTPTLSENVVPTISALPPSCNRAPHCFLIPTTPPCTGLWPHQRTCLIALKTGNLVTRVHCFRPPCRSPTARNDARDAPWERAEHNCAFSKRLANST